MSIHATRYYIVNWATKAVRELPLYVSPDFGKANWEAEYFPKEDPTNIQAYYCCDEPLVLDGIEIWYYWELSGPDGAWFLLFIPKSKKYLRKRALSVLKNSYDVTGTKVLYVKDDGVNR